MKINFQPQQVTGNSYNEPDSLTYTTSSTKNIIVVRKPVNNEAKQPDFMKDIKPGTTEREETYDGKKVKIITTTTVEQVNGNTVIKIVEESKYHTSTKTRIIHPDGSQEINSQTRGKEKECKKKVPQEFVRKYLSTVVKIGEIN